MDVDPSLPGSDPQSNNVRPPYVVFHWGSMHSFKAVVSNLNLQFTYFSSTGVPLRAQVVADVDASTRSPTRSGRRTRPPAPRSPHRVHRVQPGETLDRIAARYYGDSTRWRQIAVANGIADPLALRTGALLSVPEDQPMTNGLHPARWRR